MENFVFNILSFFVLFILVIIVYSIQWALNKKNLKSPWLLAKTFSSNTKKWSLKKYKYYKENEQEKQKILGFIGCISAVIIFYNLWTNPNDHPEIFFWLFVSFLVISYIYSFFLFKGIIRFFLSLGGIGIGLFIISLMHWWQHVIYLSLGLGLLFTINKIQKFFYDMNNNLKTLIEQNEEIRDKLSKLNRVSREINYDVYD